MKIEKFKQLRETIEVNAFENSYKWIAKIGYAFAIIAHLAGITFGYVFLYELLKDSTDEFWGKVIIVPVITLISLGSFELLKRFLFRQTTLKALISQKFTKEVITTSILSLALIILTFYLSLSGAAKMGDRTDKIETQSEITINSKTDSIAKMYDNRISKLDRDKTTYLDMITKGTKSRELRAQYNTLIDSANANIKLLEKEKEDKIKFYQSLEGNKASLKKIEVDKNIFSFIIISTSIELFILLGVWFSAFYDYRSFKEFNENAIIKSIYKKYIQYEKLLTVIYNNGKTKIDEVLDSAKKIKKIANMRGVNATENQINDFFILTKHLGITETEANKRSIKKTYEEAQLVLKENFNIKE